MGKVVTYAECLPERHAFLDTVKEKKNKVIGKEIALLRKMTSNGYKLKSNMKNYSDLMEKNLKYEIPQLYEQYMTV